MVEVVVTGSELAGPVEAGGLDPDYRTIRKRGGARYGPFGLPKYAEP